MATVPDNFKDFIIQVGEPGPYKKDFKMQQEIRVGQQFRCYIKHAPYSIMNKIKNVVVQTWKDEDGDDVFLPMVADTKPDGTIAYKPAITHEAVEYKVQFAFFESGLNHEKANYHIRMLQQAIEGRWLRIYDEYTQCGFDGVYLVDVDDDPTFKRRNKEFKVGEDTHEIGYDKVIFELTFKINGSPTSQPFDN